MVNHFHASKEPSNNTAVLTLNITPLFPLLVKLGKWAFCLDQKATFIYSQDLNSELVRYLNGPK